MADLSRSRTELRPGTLLTREWDGHLQRVMVLADGFSWNGKTYPSLSTTSMGRQTLNVLLSFAQFEREVTSERIRDKIAASKRKGLRACAANALGSYLEYVTPNR